MWIVKPSSWSKNHTSISKYFFERLLQRVDSKETISNKHRTTNGFVLLDELVKVSHSTLKRYKNTNRLRSLICESVCKELESNIKNDFIIEKNFSYIIEYYNSNAKKIEDGNKKTEEKRKEKNFINDVYLKSQSFLIALEKKYYKYLKEEIRKIDFNSKAFDKETKKIEKLIDCLIPYLLHKGYTVSMIRKAAKACIDKSTEEPVNFFLKHFDFKEHQYSFRLSLDKKIDVKIFEASLNSHTIEFKKVNSKSITSADYIIEQGESFDLSKINKGNTYEFIANTYDPYSVIRQLFVKSLKSTIIKKDRKDLSSYAIYFDSIYYKSPGDKFRKPIFTLDPIDVTQRQNTLFYTLNRFHEIEELPIIDELAEPIYYYNLALGSKSIENSLFLIWSALEALIPYNYYQNDISNIQYFVSKFLSTGSIGRELFSFIKRFEQYNQTNNNALEILGTKGFQNGNTSVSLHNWFLWVTKEFKKTEDPFDILNESPLLCKQFRKFNEQWGKSPNGDEKFGQLEIFLDRIEASRLSIYYQLDRIYLHRNQIAHSAIFLNEYSNMWSHLEWYVGKLLSYCVKYYLELENRKDFSVKNAFLNLESECGEITSYLKENKKMKITELERERFLELFSQNWQYF